MPGKPQLTSQRGRLAVCLAQRLQDQEAAKELVAERKSALLCPRDGTLQHVVDNALGLGVTRLIVFGEPPGLVEGERSGQSFIHRLCELPQRSRVAAGDRVLCSLLRVKAANSEARVTTSAISCAHSAAIDSS